MEDPRVDGLAGSSRRGSAARLTESYILAVILGFLFIGAMASYVIWRDYQRTLDIWRFRLSANVLHRVWILSSSLQQSQDDARVLAGFAGLRELLLLSPNRGTRSVRGTALSKQVAALFNDYRRVYEYAALYVLGEGGRVVLQAADSAVWATVIRSPKFNQILRAVTRSQQYAVDTIQASAQERALAFVMPILSDDTDDNGHSAPRSFLGVVAIFDPVPREFDPLLTTESAPTSTGETVLLRLQGTEAVYASPRRYAVSDLAGRGLSPDTLTQAAFSAVVDRPSFGQFTDYRGIGVMAAMQKIPSLNSVVACKVDREEALADFHRTVRLEIVTAAAVLLAYIGMIMGRRRNAFAREMKTKLTLQQAILAERLRAERSLRTANETLEMKVAERTAELASVNDRLLQELRERERSVQAQEAALAEKTVLLREVHHRVKNNLAVIASLLGMKARMADNENARSVLDECEKRVRSMALVHEHLYRSDHLDRINFSDFAATLARELYVAFIGAPGRIAIKLAVERIELNIERSVPCALILNELISNAFKHAFPDGREGEVRVSFRESARGILELTIEDNGIGMPAGLLGDSHPKSLGLRIVSLLVKQLDGSLEQQPSAGTRIVIHFATGSPAEEKGTQKSTA